MTHTNDLLQAIRSEPPGSLKLFRATEEQPEVEQAIANLGELSQRVQNARATNCLIEVVSLRLQYMDIWLRVYFENVPHQESREREFGRLLKQCLGLGLDKGLYDRLHDFNRNRVKTIHGYLVGVISYDKLAEVVVQSDGLSERLVEFVLVNSGEVVTPEFEKQHHNRGDTVQHIPRALAHLRSREPI